MIIVPIVINFGNLDKLFRIFKFLREIMTKFVLNR